MKSNEAFGTRHSTQRENSLYNGTSKTVSGNTKLPEMPKNGSAFISVAEANVKEIKLYVEIIKRNGIHARKLRHKFIFRITKEKVKKAWRPKAQTKIYVYRVCTWGLSYEDGSIVFNKLLVVLNVFHFVISIFSFLLFRYTDDAVHGSSWWYTDAAHANTLRLSGSQVLMH